jgi:hypothetical protein
MSLRLAGCDCGTSGCWPLDCELVITDDEWRLQQFSQGHRRWWTYESLGTLVFERRQVEAAFVAAGLDVPSPKPRPASTVRPMPDLDTLTLEPWGTLDGYSITDVVSAARAVTEEVISDGVSPIALALASAIGRATATADRQQLKNYVDALLHSGAHARVEQVRRQQVRSWFVETFVPCFVNLVPPTAAAGWLGARDELRGRRSRGPRTYLRREVAPPGLSLVHLVSRELEHATGIDETESRLMWSSCWYAATVALGAQPSTDFGPPMARLLVSAYELLDMLVG